MKEILVGNVSVDVIRKDIKNMHLAVYPPAGRVRIAVPLAVKDEAIRLFIISKLGWIKRNQRNFENQNRIPPREFKDRESHYFQGRRYLLRIIETPSAGKIKIKGSTYLDLYVKPEASLEYKKTLFKNWYRKELKKLLPEMVEHWEKEIGVKIDFWGIRQMKTKWGTCNIEKKHIWLNLELAKKPLHCVEYILVHEMVHLLERHHNDRFKTLMDHYLPNWRHLQAELNRLPVSHEDWGY